MKVLRERRVFRCIAMLSIALAAACTDARSPTSPPPPPPPPPPVYAGYPGFDISHYPGDAALAAWRFPASPYHWVGYYLYAPCHRDSTWMGSYARVKAMGWGTAVLYVGQQDWSMIPNSVLRARRSVARPDFDRAMASAASETRPDFDRTMASAASAGSAKSAASAASEASAASPASAASAASTAPEAPAAPATSTTVTCSASLLTSEQGTSEAADAVAKTAGEGVPSGSAIFLDVEYVSSVSPALVTYVSAWITGVLADGRFQPAIYCAKSNADVIYAAAIAAYAAAGRHDAPRFWIASSPGFAITNRPTDVGLEYANVWQGLFEVSETWGGFTSTIDIDVADSPSPSQIEPGS